MTKIEYKPGQMIEVNIKNMNDAVNQVLALKSENKELRNLLLHSLLYINSPPSTGAGKELSIKIEEILMKGN